MKKYFIGFILGAIIFGSIGVLASNIVASSITYNDTTVDLALDDLYTKSTTYKNLNTQTTAQAGDILNGKTAYDNNGNLITGTHSSGSCISSSFICDSGCDGNAGQNIIDFRPSYFVLSGTQSEYGYWWFSIYDATVSTTNTKYYDQFGNYSDDVASAGGLIISNNGVVIKNQEQLNKRMYYVACQ